MKAQRESESITIMKAVVILLAIAVSTFAAEVPIRPVHPAFAKWNRDKIVGGQEAAAHSIPYQVGLFLGGSFCGGSLISNRWVLTAAHCGELTNRPQVILGAHRIQSSESEQVILTGSQVIVHSGWNSNTLQNDIALIQLPQSVSLTNAIQPVSLAASSSGSFAGNSATASGWGLASDSATSISPVLRKVSSTILSNSQCQSEFGNSIPIYNTIICLDGSQGKSTCSGDSGGPLTVGGTQVGLTSFGVSIGCEVGYPAAFTRISSYRSWITQNSGV